MNRRVLNRLKAEGVDEDTLIDLSQRALAFTIKRCRRYKQFGDGVNEPLTLGIYCEDIVSDVIVNKLLGGGRNWPEDVELEPWLIMTVKSVISSLAKNKMTLETDSLTAYEDHEFKTLKLADSGYHPDGISNPENKLIKDEEVAEIQKILDDAIGDDEELKVLVGAMREVVDQGKVIRKSRSQLIADVIGLSVNKVYTLTRKLKRRIETNEQARVTQD